MIMNSILVCLNHPTNTKFFCTPGLHKMLRTKIREKSHSYLLIFQYSGQRDMYINTLKVEILIKCHLRHSRSIQCRFEERGDERGLDKL